MKHIDLFSGIGGFAIATEAVWDDVEHIFCDNDPFCQAILKKHWPEAQIYGDIRAFNTDSEKLRLERVRQERPNEVEFDGESEVFLLTGGFPCQPFSQAGRRKGTDDDRYLWPEMLRVIREFRPRWVIGENVAGLLTIQQGVVFQQVCADLEAENYEVQPFVIPAVAVNAPHRRDRVWIVAHDTGIRPDTGFGDREERHLLRDENGDAEKGEPERSGRKRGTGKIGADATDTASKGGERREYPSGDSTRTEEGILGRNNSDAQNPIGKRSGRRMESGGQVLGRRISEAEDAISGWQSNWLEVATRLCTLDDGLPNGLVRPKGWRNAALKGAGNAIVPQVAEEIMRGIKNT